MKSIDRPHSGETSVWNHKLHDVGVDTAEALQRRDIVAQSVTHYVACRDEFLVDDGVDADILRDVDVVDVLHQRYGLLHAVSLGLQTCQDVGLSVFRHCDKSVDTLDTFFLEHVYVAGICIDYQRVRQRICQLVAAVFVHLDNLDIHVFFETFRGDTSHSSATDNHHVFDAEFLLAAHLHKLSHRARFGDDIHHIAGLEDIAIMRDEGVLPTMYRN